MLRKEDFAVIQALVQRGVYLSDIAQQVGVHPKTVSRTLKRGSAPAKVVGIPDLVGQIGQIRCGGIRSRRLRKGRCSDGSSRSKMAASHRGSVHHSRLARDLIRFSDLSASEH
jgi:IS30 family transposase